MQTGFFNGLGVVASKALKKTADMKAFDSPESYITAGLVGYATYDQQKADRSPFTEALKTGAMATAGLYGHRYLENFLTGVDKRLRAEVRLNSMKANK